MNRVLLDTHTFLWLTLEDGRLSSAARAMIDAEDTRALVSIVSLWEIGIKSGIGKLDLPDDFDSFVAAELRKRAIAILDLELAHVYRVHALPLHHRDPFDRMLVAQSLAEGIPVVGRDRELDAYGVDRRW
ncbi:type II toxin-antitoxin system VapC family toxin [Longimicrobium terrae]|uniref:PIN domain nuclease of toxin-antitoxin system n=1 Tax=Longimicrobium terrae TaxID=1639882 RepID=A0A841GMW1_9BACT|nr:type II toxin-antitoxin system VapC family toxin [Longimicrobium terrae]MBB4635573.1 PIN domain nuclease of toxin-antitoxin system [Longimicrobium terrae]MBB6069967.1 PIN domain nuclease of toxin-antitoxin system [Longimicrobium terrae]NNC32878.1 type II toxin-antitoxin system VapC family toxin [Longimicrobium terrae]